ncbi:hypothetical protein ACS0TY_003874 [Phlomoides rotata]
MPIPKILLPSIFLALLLIYGVQPMTSSAVSGAATIDCGAACAARCRLSGRPNLCKRACGSCCSKCNCVPPGTYGNYEACSCYAKLTTRANKPKCP